MLESILKMIDFQYRSGCDAAIVRCLDAYRSLAEQVWHAARTLPGHSWLMWRLWHLRQEGATPWCSARNETGENEYSWVGRTKQKI